MATTALAGAVPGEDEDLNDEQIQELLARASARLKSKQPSSAIAKSNESQRYTFPKLETGQLEKGYVSTQGDIAVIDGSRLVDSQQRKRANGVRRVEDPIASKKEAEEVGLDIFDSSSTLRTAIMRKILPFKALSRARAPSWFAFSA